MFKKGIQTIIYLPHFLSWVILAGLILDVFSLTGIVNSFLAWFGIEPFYYLGDNRSFPWIIIMTDIWKNFGWGTVIYLAALTGIDPALYESSVIDGANRWKQTLHITIPGIVPIILLTGILSLGSVLNAGFEQIFNLYNPLVMDRGDILDTYVYRVAFKETNWGLSTMVGLIKSVVNTVLIVVGYWLAYRLTRYRIF
jgi:putative aldouronate transport system permease protein